jgi:aminopeptidase N
MWFGDLVSMRWWDDLWLNESFADHMGRWAVSRATRWEDIWVDFITTREPWGYKQDQLPTTHPVSATVPDTEAALLNFDGISYAKGASVLGQLVAWVGQDAFTDGIREYFRAHAFGNTRLADLLGALEVASGRDLTAWSRAWLQTPGVNTLTPEVTLAADGSYGTVTIHQDESPVRRPHGLAIGLYDAGGTRYRRIQLDVEGERTPVPELTGVPAAAVLLLNDDDLTYAKVRFDPASLEALLTGVSRLSSPVARALCWSALWDMTRDAELPAEVFAGAVLGQVAGEPQMAIVQGLLAHTREAVDSYLPPDARPAVLARLSDGCRELLAGAEPGGEAQLAFAYAYAGWLSSEPEVAEVRRWLDGDGVPAGLVVDQDLRWSILRRLAVLGHATGADLAAEEQRDGTSEGQLAAATARAARPTPEAKRAAWDLAVAEDSPAHLVKATATGFWQPEQLDLLRPYGERYFDLLPRLWREHGPQVSLTLAGTLYPLPLADAETAERSAARLAGDGLHPAARRILAEQADQLARVRVARSTAGG